MGAWDHIHPDGLRQPWSCPECGVYENPGPHEGHVCDPRSVARVQAARIADDVQAWLSSPAGLFESWLEQRRNT